MGPATLAEDALHLMIQLVHEMEIVSTTQERDSSRELSGAAADYMLRFLTTTPEPDLRAALKRAREAFLATARSELAPSFS
jgi:hypothetical protein